MSTVKVTSVLRCVLVTVAVAVFGASCSAGSVDGEAVSSSSSSSVVPGSGSGVPSSTSTSGPLTVVIDGQEFEVVEDPADSLPPVEGFPCDELVAFQRALLGDRVVYEDLSDEDRKVFLSNALIANTILSNTVDDVEDTVVADALRIYTDTYNSVFVLALAEVEASLEELIAGEDPVLFSRVDLLLRDAYQASCVNS